MSRCVHNYRTASAVQDEFPCRSVGTREYRCAMGMEDIPHVQLQIILKETSKMSPIKPFRFIMALALPLGGISPTHAASFASYAASEMIPSTVLVSSTCSAPPTTSVPPTTSSSNTGYSPPGYIPSPSGNRASTPSEACLSNTTFLEPYKFSKPINYAYEQFGNTKKRLDYPFRVRYAPTLGKPITSIKDDIYVTFTLNGRGVTWGRNLTSNNLSLQKADGTIVTTPI